MSDVATVTTEAPVEVSEEQRVANAMEKLDGLGKPDGFEVDQPIEESIDETEEEAVEEEIKESKSEYYLKLLKVEKENRALKLKLKGEGQPDLREIAKSDPLKALEGLGLDIDQIIDYWASQGVGDQPVLPEDVPQEEETPQTPQEVLELKKQLDDMKKNIEAKEYQAQLSNEMSKLDSMVLQNNERWEVIKELRSEGSYDLVMETAAELYKLNNEVPMYEDVLDVVEDYLLGSLQERWLKLEKVNKLKKKTEGNITKPDTTNKETKEQAKSLFSTSATTPVPTEKDSKARFDAALAMLDNLGD